ncbi:MAG: serine/threonine-protein kinase [Myxococcota bacterium]
MRSGSLGRYLLLEPLGMGGMGMVYAAYDPQLDRKLAIKLVRPLAGESGPARLLREAQAMARLSHPNVVTVHDVGTVDHQVFMAMEFIDGDSLRLWTLQRERSWRDILGVVIEAGRGLAAAHDHGLVHRDFKPDNVMIRRDGRVVVLDFGLVRAGGHDDLEPAFVSPAPDGFLETTPFDGLTKAGALLGTPAYMAPEQLSGCPADARSDQFSFCVTLHEALYGECPFPGDNAAELAAAILAGELRPEPRSSDVPRWVRALLLRGLAVEPSKRFGSMDELLNRLSRDPWRRRRVFIAAGVAAGLALLTTFTSTTLAHQRADRIVDQCNTEGQEIDEVWNDDARARLRHAFMETGSSFAEASHERMSAWLDPWTARWARDRTQLCLQARRDEGLEPAKLQMATTCFDEQREQLAVMLEVFGDANVDMVAGAAKAAANFSQLESCADERAMAQRPVIPERLHQDPRLSKVREQLARSSALRDAGDYWGGGALAQQAVSTAMTLEWPPLEAEARIAVADAHSELGRYAEVLEQLRTAFKLALASGSDPLAARAATMLLRVQGYHLTRIDEALQWADVAEGLLERLGRMDGLDAAQWANNVALVHEVDGDYESSELWHHRALGLRQKVLSDDHPEAAHSYANLGNLALWRQEVDDATRWHRRALRVRSESLGPGHPDVARSHSSIGRVHLARGELDEALRYFQSGYDILDKSVGGHHRVAARILDDIGRAQLQRGEPTTALRHFEQAARVQRALLGPQHHETAQTTFDIGRALLAQGHYEPAFTRMNEAAVAFRASLGDEHPRLQQIRDAMADLCAMGQAQACSW